MPGKKTFKIMLVLLILGMAAMANAQLAVSIQPADNRDFFYFDEARMFRIVIINTANAEVKDQQFKIQASNELVLLENNKETSQITFAIPQMLGGENVSVPFWAKAKTTQETKGVLSVNFGQIVFSEVTARQTQIKPLPFELQVTPKHLQMALSETNEITVLARNDSNQSISDFSAAFVAQSPFFELSPHPITTHTLDTNTQWGPVSFEFISKGTALGRFDAVVLIDFTDNTGVHRLDKRFPIKIEDRSLSMLGSALLIIVLIWFFVTSTQSAKQKSSEAPKSEAKPKNKKN